MAMFVECWDLPSFDYGLCGGKVPCRQSSHLDVSNWDFAEEWLDPYSCQHVF